MQNSTLPRHRKVNPNPCQCPLAHLYQRVYNIGTKSADRPGSYYSPGGPHHKEVLVLGGVGPLYAGPDCTQGELSQLAAVFDALDRLEDDDDLRALCGFTILPHRTTFNRFIRRLSHHTDLVQAALTDLTSQLRPSCRIWAR